MNNVCKTLILIGGLVLIALPATAQTCLPGLPCVTPATAISTPPDPPVVSLNAAKSENPACDADFMNQIYAKAFLEGTRQVVTNETLIRKPDSVLQYSCFDMQARQATPYIGERFTNTQNWDNGPFSDIPIHFNLLGPLPYLFLGHSISIGVYMDPDRLDQFVADLVLSTLGNYFDPSFAYNFLGNTSSISFAAATANCTYMNDVYFEAKCKDFETDDQFLSFRTLVNLDPRQQPEACQNGTGITDDIIDVSENAGFTYVNQDLDNPATVDPSNTKFDVRLDAAPCLPPVPTGVMVTRQVKTVGLFGNVTISNTTAYGDQICPNPSCYYDNVSNSCKP